MASWASLSTMALRFLEKHREQSQQVGFVTHQKHFQPLDIVDQELPEATGQHVLCFLVAPVTDVGHQDLALESSSHSVVSTPRFPPVTLNFDIAVWLLPDELLGPLFLLLGSHDA
jgi:hypothetical protein